MNPDSRTFSSKDYVGHGGSKCPVCGSTNVNTTSDIEADGANAWQEVSCSHCQSEWTDTFVLSGYTNLKVGNKA